MSGIDPSVLDQRKAQILRALVENYILTANPVGSQVLAKSEPLGLSPATIRHVMSQLTDLGYLEQPHTSAGRIPTEKGYRFYIDCLLQVDPLDEGLKKNLRASIEGASGPQAILQNASRMLSGISRQVGVILAPKLESSRLKHIEFLDLGEGKILAILVTEQGVVQNRLLEQPEVLSSAEWIRINNYLKSLLTGLSLSDIKTRILLEMETNKDALDQLLRHALVLSAQAVQPPEHDLFIEGERNFFYTQEFANLSRIQEILELLGEKRRIVSFLERVSAAPGVQIFVGNEADLMPRPEISVVVANYGSSDGPLGALGVIGPTRMEYSKVIPIVEFTAQLMSEAFD